MSKQYGWFSEKQLAVTGNSIVYNTPSGKQITITQVSDSPTTPESNHSDAVCRGEITDFVRTDRDPNMKRPRLCRGTLSLQWSRR